MNSKTSHSFPSFAERTNGDSESPVETNVSIESEDDTHDMHMTRDEDQTPTEENTQGDDKETSRDEEKKKEKQKKSKIMGCLKCLVSPCTLPCSLVCKLLNSEPGRYKSIKLLFGFPFGALLAYGLYNLVVKPMSFPKETREFIGALMGLGISTGFALSVPVRCICFLLIPTFFGKAGRSYVGTFAISFLISGPIENIINNAQDITRSLSCASELIANHTATKWQFRMQPIGNVLTDMQEEGFLLTKIGKKVEKAFGPIKREIRGTDEDKEEDKPQKPPPTSKKVDSKEVEKSYKKRLSFRCDDVYKAAIRKCKDVFDNIYNKCMRDLPAVVDLLCNFVRLHSLCNIIKVLPGMDSLECDSSDMVNDNFGEMYKTSEESISSMEGGFDVSLQYKVVHTREDIDITTAEEMRMGVMHDFGRGRTIVEFFLILVKRLLSFTFLLVVFGAYKYHKSYLSDIRHDNFYITSYFRKIDARRKVRQRRTLFPFKKMEKETVVFPLSLKLMKCEKKKLGKGTFLLLTRALLSSLIFFTDYLLFTAMDIIRRHSRVDYKHYGVNNINVDIGGTGFMSMIVRLFLKGLNTKHTLDRTSTNLECLPRPIPLHRKYFVYVFGVYFIVWLLILLEAYGLRLRKIIAGFFYRKREKQRILYFYNSMLKKRRCFLKLARRKVKRKARQMKLRKAGNLCFALMRRFPGLCKCLSLCPATKRQCLICDEIEQKDFTECDTEGCHYVYCPECWFDVKERCYACIPQDEALSTDSDDIDAYLTDDD